MLITCQSEKGSGVSYSDQHLELAVQTFHALFVVTITINHKTLGRWCNTPRAENLGLGIRGGGGGGSKLIARVKVDC